MGARHPNGKYASDVRHLVLELMYRFNVSIVLQSTLFARYKTETLQCSATHIKVPHARRLSTDIIDG